VSKSTADVVGTAADCRAAPAAINPRAREPLALLSVLALALALRWWELERIGWGAEYYTAAVRSMGLSWHNFFFAAFDPAGFISVDKPPVALWLQVLSVKLLGFNPVGVILPQVLEGVAAVWVLYRMVRLRFDALAALLAALFLATTPVWVAANRTNNMDSCLLLVLLLAGWALLKAAERGSRRLLCLAMALVGLAFNVKMLAAFVVLPGFFLTYLIAAPRQWPRRLIDLALASVVLGACSLPWVLANEATPAESRPYVGSSRGNSMLELVVGHNAAGRFMRKAQAPTRNSRDSAAPLAGGTEPRTDANNRPETGTSMRSDLARQFVQTPTGPLRLAGGLLGAQVEWLLPLALLALPALVGGAGQIRRREPLSPEPLAVMFWLSWSITYVLVYSALGGIMHFYYLATLGPALGALAGIGVSGLWARHRGRERLAVLLPAGLLLCAAWQFYLQASALGWGFAEILGPSEKWLGWLHIALGAGSVAAATVLVVAAGMQLPPRAAPMIGAGALALGIAALLALPLAWSLSAVLAPANGILPSADLQRLIAASRNAVAVPRSRFGLINENSRLVGFLKANRGDERFLFATSTVHVASHVIIATGEPVMARGGFHGLDAALSPEKLARMAGEKQIRFVLLGDTPAISRRMGADDAGKPVADWVRSNGKLVEPALWRAGRGGSSVDLYDLRPEAGLIPAPQKTAATPQEP